jgi:signal transduction histidine kinase
MLTTRINALLHDSGMRVPWTVTVQLGDQPLGRKLERQLYLIVREAVSNVERHANASTASLTLRTRGDTVHLEISDDGQGFDRSRVPEGSVGLRSMEERVADLGGSIVITSRPGEGASLIATLPIQEMNDGG